jgi:hypothetical protein
MADEEQLKIIREGVAAGMSGDGRILICDRT